MPASGTQSPTLKRRGLVPERDARWLTRRRHSGGPYPRAFGACMIRVDGRMGATSVNLRSYRRAVWDLNTDRIGRSTRRIDRC